MKSRIFVSPKLSRLVPEDEILVAFGKHDSGDWGMVSSKAKETNLRHLRSRESIESRFISRSGVHFTIKTSGDSRYTFISKNENGKTT